MLGDIIRENDDIICKDGHWKKDWRGIKDMCYLSVHLNNFNHEYVVSKCKYMEGYFKEKIGKHTLCYSKCKFKKPKPKEPEYLWW